MSKILNKKELKEVVAQLKSEGKRIVTTSGAFDLLHWGHVQSLIGARLLGDVLIVFLNCDERVRQAKGKERPIIPQEYRAKMLEALECVDYIYIFYDKTPRKLLFLIKPSIFAKGGEYTGVKIAETDVMKRIGGECAIVEECKGIHTTEIIKKIIEIIENK
jgi:rfaE bifunctional protein nucleotidyltransferase chain/domain